MSGAGQIPGGALSEGGIVAALVAVVSLLYRTLTAATAGRITDLQARVAALESAVSAERDRAEECERRYTDLASRLSRIEGRP